MAVEFGCAANGLSAQASCRFDADQIANHTSLSYRDRERLASRFSPFSRAVVLGSRAKPSDYTSGLPQIGDQRRRCAVVDETENYFALLAIFWLVRDRRKADALNFR